MCDTLCLRTDAGMLFTKNSDRHFDEAQVVEWNRPRPSGGELHTQYLTVTDAGACGVTGSRPTWLWGYEHGVNEYDVAIGNEKVWTTTHARDLPPALLGMDLVRLGLERARTADDALGVVTQLLEVHGQGGSGEPDRDEPYFSSFLIADPSGGWVLETSDRTWAARPAGTGAAISNRISITTEWTRASSDVQPGASFDAWRDPDRPTTTADDRLATTSAALTRAATPEQLAVTLRDHGGGDGSETTVCMHRGRFAAHTTASIIVQLRADTPQRVWTCLGNPCCSIYVPAFPPAIPPELGDASQWKRFAGVRDAVDGGELALAEVRAVFDPVEHELWSEADAAFATGDRSPLDRFARTAYRPVDAALQQLGV